jgi:hypothetical protein
MQVGQKVVCINDEFPDAIAEFYTMLPKKGLVYVIREVVLGINPQGQPGEVCLYLIGLVNPRSTTPPFPERGFSSERFRPLDEVQQRNKKHDYEPKEYVHQ